MSQAGAHGGWRGLLPQHYRDGGAGADRSRFGRCSYNDNGFDHNDGHDDDTLDDDNLDGDDGHDDDTLDDDNLDGDDDDDSCLVVDDNDYRLDDYLLDDYLVGDNDYRDDYHFDDNDYRDDYFVDDDDYRVDDDTVCFIDDNDGDNHTGIFGRPRGL